MTETQCPACGHQGQVAEAFCGRQVQCPNCYGRFRAVAANKAGVCTRAEAPPATPIRLPPKRPRKVRVKARPSKRMVVGAAAAGVGLGLVVLVAGVWALWPRPHKRLEQAALPAVALLPAAPATHRPVAAAPTPTLSQAPAPAKPAPPTTAAKRTEPPPAAQVPEPDYEVRQEGKLAPSAPAAPPPKPTEEPEEDADESLPGMEKGSQLEKLVNAMTNPAVVLRDRVRCAEAIGKLGPKGKPATRALCRAMLKSPPLLRVAATNAL